MGTVSGLPLSDAQVSEEMARQFSPIPAARDTPSQAAEATAQHAGVDNAGLSGTAAMPAAIPAPAPASNLQSPIWSAIRRDFRSSRASPAGTEIDDDAALR